MTNVSLTWVNAALQRILTDMKTSTVAGNYDGALVGAKIMLGTAWPGVGATLVTGDITEATYNGYARTSITAWTGAPYVGNDGDPAVQPVPAAYLFRPADPNPTPEEIVVAALLDQNDVLLAAGGLVPTWNAITADDVLNLLVEITMPTLSNLGAFIGEG